MEKYDFEISEKEKYGFKITEKRIEVWRKEIEMLILFDNICRKNNIKYSLSAGTLLGAVRHKGFIPWDDDIDVVMKRDEYNKFLKVVEGNIPSNIFFQCYLTEKRYYYGHAQLRNCETTAIILGDASNKDFNHGIFIDIFPLDNVPDDDSIRKRFLQNIKMKKNYIRKIIQIKNNPSSSSKIKKIFKKLISLFYTDKRIDRDLKSFNEYIQKYNTKKTIQCGAIGFSPEMSKYDNEWFEKYKNVLFENMTAMSIKHDNELLVRQYGNYMEIPKDKDAGALHGSVFFDTKNSYKKYYNDLEKIEEMILRDEIKL